MSKPIQILLRHARKDPPTPGKPGIFALGGSGVLRGLLAESALADVEARIVRARLRLASAAEALQMMQQAFGAYRGSSLTSVQKLARPLGRKSAGA